VTQLHRSAVIEGQVFCRIRDRTVPLDTCVDCSHIKAMNDHGTSPFIVCDVSRPDEEDGGQRMLAWWSKRSRRSSAGPFP